MLTTKTTYNKYPTGLKIQFAQNALNKSLFKTMPRSTRQHWKNFNVEKLYAPANAVVYDHENIALINALVEIQQLKKVIRALAYVIVVYKKFLSQFIIARENMIAIQSIVLICIKHLENNFPKEKIYKWLPLTSHQWAAWSSRKVCKFSLIALCKRKYPHQLTMIEINTIKESCINNNYKYWPLISIYYKMLKDKILFCSPSTFYKYCRLLNITRTKNKSKKIITH